MHQNFEVITGLNYRFVGNLNVRVFSTYETGIMTTVLQKTLLCAVQVQAGVLKTFA